MEQYEKIQQLLKKEPGIKERVPIFPPTVIQAVFDGKTGASLEAILAQFNSITVQYQGSPRDTRLAIPMEMRRPGLTITYTTVEGDTLTERANSQVTQDDNWALDTNWSRIDELSLSGDIAVSARGTWIINGADTGIKAVGPKGENGITPWLKEIDNKLHYSYDNVKWTPCSGPLSAQFRNHNNRIQISYDKGKTWTDISDPVATYVRFAATSSTGQDGSIGKLQYSHDKSTWHDLSPEFRNYLRIQGYVATADKLPTGVPVGTIYGVGPFYEAGDTTNSNPMYQLRVWDGTQWVHNGTFNSIAAGIVQETGNSETEVMSQKAVSKKLSELGSEVIEGVLDNNYQKGENRTFALSVSSAYNISDIAISQSDVVVIETLEKTKFSVYALQDGQIIDVLAKDVELLKISLYIKNVNEIRVYNEIEGTATTFYLTLYKKREISSTITEIDSKVGEIINKSRILLNRGSGHNFYEFIYKEDGFAQINVNALDKFVYSVYEIVDGVLHLLKQDVTTNVLVTIRKGNILRIYGEVESVAESATFEVLQIEKQDIVAIMAEKEKYLVNSNYIDESYDVSEKEILIGIALNADGTTSLTDSQVYKTTNYIDIQGSICIKVRNNFCLYDIDKTFIGGFGIWNPSDLTEYEYILPNNAAYFRAQLSNSDTDFSAEYRYTTRKQTSSMRGDVITMSANLFDKTLESEPIIATPNQTETKFLKIPKSADEVIITGYSRLLYTWVYNEDFREIARVADNGVAESFSNQTILKHSEYPDMRYVKRLISTSDNNDIDSLNIACTYNINLYEIAENKKRLNDTLALDYGTNLPFVCPEDFEGETMAEKVSKANDFVLKSKGRFGLLFGKNATETARNTYLIDRAIVVDSNTIIKVVNSTIQMKDYVVDNMFRTANIIVDNDNPLGFAKNKSGCQPLSNIKVLGENATIMMPINTEKSSVYEVGWRGMTSYFFGVENFEFAGFKVENNLAWSLAFADCRFGKIHDIEFNTNRGNGDGVDLYPCNNVSVYNISGTTEDDTIALGSLTSERLVERPFEEDMPVRPFDYDFHPFGGDVYNIYIDNVYTNGVNVSGACVDIVADKFKIYDIYMTRLKSGENKPCTLLLWAGYGSKIYRNHVFNIFANDIQEVKPNTYGAIWFRGDAPSNSQINKVRYSTLAYRNDSGINDFESIGLSVTNVNHL